ncbi:MAG: bifunctional diaminohydroxyphosphoribosylaminopyrimidine deaminase/5-amino-6-(5-phosphoribosylamino)uracil reductase RibD [Alphaproteobacteria bacterium]|nr:bifunctional diaminohydroxyphosphoribosylaminopyrimidine deaminase/5-amino-6-(5-phosphoribosylamino)uracil reductase RibD [Alphaproteobacteria bacterium]
MTANSDIHYMRHALAVARRGLGRMGSVRPSVGCVLVKDGRVRAAARTGDGGAPHAESAALAAAGEDAQDTTAYVTLEPCAHHGRTPPCAKALVDAGIARCVIGALDPFEKVNGKGVEMLRAGGVAVDLGVLEEECRAANQGFFLAVRENRPFVTLKCAVSADGKIAAAPGERTQITGELAHRYLHHLRSFYDAILVGKTTMEVDQPQLTTRIEGYVHEAQRIVLDRPVQEMLEDLAARGITRLLVEGGAKTHTSFLESGLYDEVILLKSPKVLGEGGVDAADFSNLKGLKSQKTRALGEDLLAIYGCSA